MNADMVAIEVIRRLLRHCGIEAEADAALELVLEILGSPALLEEEKFQACALAILTKLFAVAEKFGDAFNNRDYLVPADESIEAQREVRVCGEASADTQREAKFGIWTLFATNRCKAYIVDLRVSAPDVAAGDANLELAGEIIKIGVANERLCGFTDER